MGTDLAIRAVAIDAISPQTEETKPHGRYQCRKLQTWTVIPSALGYTDSGANSSHNLSHAPPGPAEESLVQRLLYPALRVPPFSPGQDDTAPTGKIRDVCLQSHILHPISETASLSTLWSKILSPTREEPFYQTQGSINKEGQKARQFRTDRQ